MWRELIRSLEADATCADGVTHEALSDAESKLGDALPDDLRSLPEESNGASGS